MTLTPITAEPLAINLTNVTAVLTELLAGQDKPIPCLTEQTLLTELLPDSLSLLSAVVNLENQFHLSFPLDQPTPDTIGELMTLMRQTKELL